MHDIIKSGLAGALGLTLATTAWAGPTTFVPLSAVSGPSGIELVRYHPHAVHHARHAGHWRPRHHARYGYNPGAAMFGAVLGMIASGAFNDYDYPYYGYGYPYYAYGYGYPAYGYGWARPPSTAAMADMDSAAAGLAAASRIAGSPAASTAAERSAGRASDRPRGAGVAVNSPRPGPQRCFPRGFAVKPRP